MRELEAEHGRRAQIIRDRANEDLTLRSPKTAAPPQPNRPVDRPVEKALRVSEITTIPDMIGESRQPHKNHKTNRRKLLRMPTARSYTTSTSPTAYPGLESKFQPVVQVRANSGRRCAQTRQPTSNTTQAEEWANPNAEDSIWHLGQSLPSQTSVVRFGFD